MVDADTNPTAIEIENPYDMESLIPLKNGKEYHFAKVENAGFT